MFQATYACSKSYRKDYKQDLLSNNRYRLKLLQRNYFLTILAWKNLWFTEKIHSNARLPSSDVFHMFTQSINFVFNSIIVQLSEKRDSSNRQ